MTLQSFCQRWQCAQVITHICRACSRKLSSIHMGVWFPRWNRFDRNCFFHLSGAFYLLNRLWKGKRNVLWNRGPSRAFTALKKFDCLYFCTNKYKDVMIFWLARKRARSRQLTFVWKRFENFERCGRFISIWYESVHRIVICRCRVNIGSLSRKHLAVDRVRMHNFEPKIEDLAGFNNYGDTLMKEEFVYLGNTSSMRLL